MLTKEERIETSRAVALKLFVEPNETANLDTEELSGIVANLDDFFEVNQEEIDKNIDAALKNKATQEQKLQIFALVAMKRARML